MKPSLLDSAGRAVESSLKSLGYGEATNVRIGKTVLLDVAEFDEARVRAMCDQLLANPVIEDYTIEVVP